MKPLTTKEKISIDIAVEYSDDNNKSTEWMLAFCADEAGVSIERVVDYLKAKVVEK